MSDRERQLREEALEAQKTREQELEDIRWIMSDPRGRRFIWRLLTLGNIFRICFTGNSSTFYNEGKRESHLVYYQDIMEACPEQFWIAQNENWQPEKKG